MNSTEISEIIMSRLADQRLSLAMLAERIAVPASVIEGIAAGETKLPLEYAERLAVALDTDPAVIAGPLLRQHFSSAAIDVLNYLCNAGHLTEAEKAWLSLLRVAAPDGLEPPSRIARRVICSLLANEEAHS